MDIKIKPSYPSYLKPVQLILIKNYVPNLFLEGPRSTKQGPGFIRVGGEGSDTTQDRTLLVIGKKISTG